MFHFPGFASSGRYPTDSSSTLAGFPIRKSPDISATNRLPGAYRRLVASFIAVLGQGIHRALLCLSYGDLYTTIFFAQHFNPHDKVAWFFIYLSRIRMSKIRVSHEMKEPPEAVLSRLHARALRPIRSKDLSVLSVRRHVEASIDEGPRKRKGVVTAFKTKPPPRGAGAV